MGFRLLLTLVVFMLAVGPALAGVHALVVVGVGGDEEQERRLGDEADGWEKLLAACKVPEGNVTVIRSAQKQPAAGSVREQVLLTLKQWSASLTADDDAVLVFIGHGSTRGGAYQFDNRGKRLTAKDLVGAIPTNAGSFTIFGTGPGSSGLHGLSGRRLAVITATAGETEINQTQFGSCWLEVATASPGKPLPQLLKETDEKVAAYYKSRSLARTEHAAISIGGRKPLESPFDVNLPDGSAWTLASPGAWAKSATNPGTRPAGDASNVEH